MQQPSFEANLTVERALELYGFMWKLPSRKRKEKVIELLNAFDLENIRNIKNDELSIGQRRRVQVATVTCRGGHKHGLFRAAIVMNSGHIE